MVEYGFRYTVNFKGEELEQVLIAPDKESAQKALNYHIQIAEKNPDKVKIISTEVEIIPEEEILKEDEQPIITEVN